jgi:hypothetical protein
MSIKMRREKPKRKKFFVLRSTISSTGETLKTQVADNWFNNIAEEG